MIGRFTLVGFGIVVMALTSAAVEQQPIQEIKKEVKFKADEPKASSNTKAEKNPVQTFCSRGFWIFRPTRSRRPRKHFWMGRSKSIHPRYWHFSIATLSNEDSARLLTTIRRLGDDDFDVREAALDELTRAGLAALPILRIGRPRQERRNRPSCGNLPAVNQSGPGNRANSGGSDVAGPSQG